MMQMHYAPTLKRAVAKDPMCGYVAPDDEICLDPDYVPARNAWTGSGPIMIHQPDSEAKAMTDDELQRLLNDFAAELEPDESPSLLWAVLVSMAVSIAIVAAILYGIWRLAHG